MSERWTKTAIYADATVEPVTVEDLRSQVRITTTDEDATLEGYLKAARLYVEAVTGRKLITQTWDVYYTSFDDLHVLPFAPLGSAGITSVKYQDQNNTQQTAASTLYETGERNERPTVRLKYLQSWPATLGHPDDVVVRAPFGYGATAASVPQPLKQAIALLAAHWNEHREPVLIGVSGMTLPFGIDALLGSYAIREF